MGDTEAGVVDMLENCSSETQEFKQSVHNVTPANWATLYLDLEMIAASAHSLLFPKQTKHILINNNNNNNNNNNLSFFKLSSSFSCTLCNEHVYTVSEIQSSFIRYLITFI
jgi:hypothetical protein